ncbi:MAG: hypothetical protein JSV78_00870, partial [Phycisphaerales bacterium]
MAHGNDTGTTGSDRGGAAPIGPAPEVSPRPTVLIIAGAIALVALILLYLCDVPIGQPHLLYRHSPLVPLRLIAAVFALIFGGIAIWALYEALHIGGRWRRWFGGVGILGYIALVFWTYFAPPAHFRQIIFNLQSPSHDGAFVVEGWTIESIPEYLSSGFYERLRNEPEDMAGRRVLSNPPGATVVALLCRRWVERSPGLRTWLLNRYGELKEVDEPFLQTTFAANLVLAMLFTVAWGLSLVFGYRLCRLWMPPLASAAVAFACVFNPSTVNFTPGKDPAQMLTVLAILYFWFAGYLRGGKARGFVVGLIFAAATMIGLIHVWILAIAAVATFWHAVLGRNMRDRALELPHALRRWLTCCLVPAVGGGLVVAIVAYLTLDWNVVKCALLVGLRYGDIQEGIIAEPVYWALVGLPMFLLFVGPMPWVQVLGMRKDVSDGSVALARDIMVCTVIVLIYTYFFANNNETPRLWMPFIPLLIIPLALRRSLFRLDTIAARRVCILLLAIQLVVTVFHWSLMDVRESEYRIFETQRMF